MTNTTEVIEVKRSIASLIKNHTILAAYSTVDTRITPGRDTPELRADLLALAQMESSPIVDASLALVDIAIEHSLEPSETTHADARIARDALGTLLMRVKEVRG